MVALTIRSPGLTSRRYDDLMVGLALDVVPPIGQILHMAVERPEGVVIHEVWQTPAAALHYLGQRLTPALAEVGAGEPEADLAPLHNLFAADLDTVERLGAVSLPAHAAGSVLY